MLNRNISTIILLLFSLEKWKQRAHVVNVEKKRLNWDEKIINDNNSQIYFMNTILLLRTMFDQYRKVTLISEIVQKLKRDILIDKEYEIKLTDTFFCQTFT